MKKFISVILSASIITASMAVPVFADYTAPAPDNSYDAQKVNLTYDDGTVDNAIDNSKAKQVTDRTIIWQPEDGAIFTKEFYMSFDFRFDTQSDNSVSGNIALNKLKSSGNDDKIGPVFSYNGTKLITTTSKGTQEIASISADKWYRAELEGKMVVVGASVKMTVYDEAGENVGSVDVLDLRQFYAGASNGNPNGLTATKVSIDNVKFIQEYPDTVTVTAAADELNAGNEIALDYSMSRLDKTMTKYAVDWSVYDASDNEINDGSITVDTSTGTPKLKALISATGQTVKVRATAKLGDTDVTKELYGEKAVTIKAVDTGDAKFDTITLSGADTVKAGASTQAYTYTTSKSGTDNTASIEEGDIIWKVYNADNLAVNGNKGITLTGGVLTVDEGVLPQTVYVRAECANNANVYNSVAVSITQADSDKETHIYTNACETALDTVDRVVSVDGSTAYFTKDTTTMAFGDHSEYTVTDLDLKFGEESVTEYSGIRFKRNDGSELASFFIKDGALQQQTGSSSHKLLYSDIKADTWYHLEILYNADEKHKPEGEKNYVTDKAYTASIIIYEYQTDGTLEPVATVKAINKRNAFSLGKIEVQANTYIDNVKVVTALPDEITVTAANFVFAGETLECEATASRHGLPIDIISNLTWTVRDDIGPLPSDSGISVNEKGVVSVDALANAGDIKVRAAVSNEVYGEKTVTVQMSEIFSVTNIGINKDKDKIVKLYVTKNFAYNDDVVFVLTIYKNGTLTAVKTLKTFGDRMSIGGNELSVELDLPSDFDPETYSVQAMAWTLF